MSTEASNDQRTVVSRPNPNHTSSTDSFHNAQLHCDARPRDWNFRLARLSGNLRSSCGPRQNANEVEGKTWA